MIVRFSAEEFAAVLAAALLGNDDDAPTPYVTVLLNDGRTLTVNTVEYNARNNSLIIDARQRPTWTFSHDPVAQRIGLDVEDRLSSFRRHRSRQPPLHTIKRDDLPDLPNPDEPETT